MQPAAVDLARHGCGSDGLKLCPGEELGRAQGPAVVIENVRRIQAAAHKGALDLPTSFDTATNLDCKE